MTVAELVTPRVTVTMATGETWTVATGNPDLVAWDMTAAKHKWPGFRDAPFLWLTFLAWHASRRRGLLPEQYTAWEAFRGAAESVEGPDPGDTTADGLPDDAGMPGWVMARPTEREPTPD